MQYRKNKYGHDISLLGFGCMRLTHSGPGIDIDKSAREIKRAFELGVNYFDTAYTYPGSEEALGLILEREQLRDKVYIATKLPQYLVNSSSAIERFFQEELRRLRTDRIDYYLMHMLTDLAAWQKLERLGIREWIKQKKEAGQIVNIGFSFHGNTDQFLAILAAYEWDFCQIQYNYLDEHTQAGRKGLEAAQKRGIPVIIMEPLRGGKLVNALPADAQELIAREAPGRKPAELAFRWLYDQPGVTCVLSGMNSLEMVEENCRWAAETGPGTLTEADFAFYDRLRAIINAHPRVGCTACGYCMPCPQGVDIPGTFRCWNRMYSENKWSGCFEYFQTVSLQKEQPFATRCVACGRCEKRCPQHISIIEELKQADRALRPPYIRVANKVAHAWLFRRGQNHQDTHQ
ncbi:MAG: aldo/keto reductase [Clostridia bacterium]|nr:aldo/keto reductase [Clostridia bacterium]